MVTTCDICYSLNVGAHWAEKRGWRREAKGSSLAKVSDVIASSARCLGCRLVAKGLSLWSLPSSAPIHIVFETGLPIRVESQRLTLEFFVPPGGDLPTPNFGHGTEIVGPVDAETAAAFALKHLGTCGQEHATCKRSALVSTRRPSRLIDTGSIGSLPGLRLVSEVDPDLPYVALSYCWGLLANNTKTTRSNLEDRLAGIDYLSLPKTLRDAVDVTRALGVRYLWIDALCIIQDDDLERDWRIESAKMGSIYQGAFLTLSATKSATVDEGFLGPRRDALQLKTQQVEWLSASGDTHTISIRRRLSHAPVVAEGARPVDCPLLTRGWAFQERLMSTRTLHFLPHEVLWECKSDFACECLGVEADQTWKPRPERGSLLNRTLAQPGRLDLAGAWQGIVTEYSRRALTKAGDRLPALTGIARMMDELAEGKLGRYLAGLWTEGLAHQLAWQAELPPLSSPRARGDTLASHYVFSFKGKEKARSALVGSTADSANFLRKPITPSWSWISTSHPVRWEVRPRTPTQPPASVDPYRVRILEASCAYDPINEFGQVSSGRLVLEADVVSTTIENLEQNSVMILKTSSTSTEAVFLPDVHGLDLNIGDSIHCALLYVYGKDGQNIWVALGLRRVVDNAEDDSDPTESKFVPHEKMVLRAAYNWYRALQVAINLHDTAAYKYCVEMENAEPKLPNSALLGLVSYLRHPMPPLEESISSFRDGALKSTSWSETMLCVQEDFFRTRLSEITSGTLPPTLKDQLAQAAARYQKHREFLPAKWLEMTVEDEYNRSLASWNAKVRTGRVEEVFYRVGLVRIATSVSTFSRAGNSEVAFLASSRDFFSGANRTTIIIN